jgi:hypothetical protein
MTESVPRSEPMPPPLADSLNDAPGSEFQSLNPFGGGPQPRRYRRWEPYAYFWGSLAGVGVCGALWWAMGHGSW